MSADDDDDDIDSEYSLFLTRVAEKIMQLSIAFITEYFPSGDNLHSPLVHFADIMGISNRYVRFNEAYNYTSYIARLMWMCRFLIMEYALPSQEYTTLGWPSYEAYEQGERLKWIHHECLVLGSFKPMNRLIRVLNVGQETIKKVGRPCMLRWDLDREGVTVKEVHLRLDAFKQFVQDGIESSEEFLWEKLFFGTDLPMIDLKKIDDVMEKKDRFYSFMKESAAQLPDGREYMFNLQKSLDPSKQLIDAQGRSDGVKVKKYLKAKMQFQRKLMKGIIQSLKLILLNVRHISQRSRAIQRI